MDSMDAWSMVMVNIVVARAHLRKREVAPDNEKD
jgi:hypothetical protein